MIADLIRDDQFIELEKEYKFLARARGEQLANGEYVIVDVETTGLEPAQSELTEIGALKIKAGEIKDIFSSLIRPKNPIPPEITRLTGIDDAMVKDFPGAGPILEKFSLFAGPNIIIAHNTDFDVPFLKHHLKQTSGRELNNETICTLKTSRLLLPNLPNHKLHTIAQHFGLTAQNRHRAMGDVELTFQIWLKFIDLLKDKGIMTKRELDALTSQL
ncbi:MAG: 3'-5' exonuclease [Candidatus Margulisbacteria bacterium]|nr:3'-5' exonuclease [Candidatus Margulisiibacteriota bacterium]